ncbi:hypothetical protein VTO42DRAFT_2385 [Malbranchea cinnamomea]
MADSGDVQLEIDGSTSSAVNNVQSTPTTGRCNPCRVGHNKCDGARPACGLCVKRGRECTYTRLGQTSSANRPGAACLICRNKKRKCDSVKPVCGPCKNRETECVYGSALKRPRSSQVFGGGLDSSPTVDEKEFSRPRKHPRLSPPPPTPPPPATIHGKLLSVSTEGRDNSVQRGRASVGSVISSMRDATSSISDQESDTGQKTREPPSLPRQRIQPLFTPSPMPENGTKAHEVARPSVQLASHKNGKESDEERDEKVATVFMSSIKQAVLQRTDTSKPGSTIESRRELERLQNLRKGKSELQTVTPDPEDMALPEREFADHLISDYLTREYVNLPIFNLTSFQAKYRAIWLGGDGLEDMDIFRATLNIMFALVSLSLKPNNRSDATMYFRRAQNLMNLGGFEQESLGHVQACILASQYLLAVDNLSAAWKSIGIAISIAQSLRLHLTSGSQHLPKRYDRELARRLWHGCIIMQRTIAMQMGSTPLVAQNAFKTPLPTPLENEYIDTIFGGEPQKDTDRPSIIEFFTALARLYEKYDNVIAIQDELRLAGGRSPQKVLDCFDAKAILEADHLLYSWKASLPPYLQPENDDHPSLKSPIARRQHNILRVRYLHMRILVWRPFLAINAASPSISPFVPAKGDESVLQHSVDAPLSYTLVHEGAIKCILAARELVDIITAGKSETLEPVTPWWENVGYAFACANVFIAARLCPASVHEELPNEEFIEQGWRRSVKLLEDYSDFSSLALKCISALEHITDALLQEEEHEVIGDDGSSPQFVRDMSWLECLPVDLAN